eukprot:11187778-Lingulodinium_polyedra.AAC.1
MAENAWPGLAWLSTIGAEGRPILARWPCVCRWRLVWQAYSHRPSNRGRRTAGRNRLLMARTGRTGRNC